uniref:C1q domain-containing protein n=1 Tax=Panagrellus redivivus TaxID=6233 RepID=A0A7E4V4E4_PANRE
MFFQALFAFALIAVANSCGPASGRLLQNPTFTFSFAPPVSWTFYTQNGTATLVPYPGQVTSQAAALQNAEQAIDNAIFYALREVGYSSVGWSWTISGYNPTSILVVADSDTTNAVGGTYVPTLPGSRATTVYAVRTGTAAPYGKTDYVNSLTVAVKGPTFYYESAWNDLANYVFNRLTIENGVKFWSGITIA